MGTNVTEQIFSVMKNFYRRTNWFFCDKTFIAEFFWFCDTSQKHHRTFGSTCLRPLWQLMWHAVNAVKWRGQDIVALHVVSFTLAGDVLGSMGRKEDSHVATGCKSMSFCYEGTCHFHICPRVLFLCSHVSVVGCPMCLLLGDPRVIFVLIQVLFSYWSMVGKRMTKVLPKELITATKSWKSCC